MKVAVLVSGNGSNLGALLAAAASDALGPARVALVVSNRADAYALHRATAAGVPSMVIAPTPGQTREAYDAALVQALHAAHIELVVLAGFMRILSPVMVNAYPGRILNVHPSLLPAFPGTHAPRQALAHGVKIAGATVHFVDASLDGGPIIAQHCCQVESDDTETTLHARIQTLEHALLPRVVRALALGQLTMVGRTVLGLEH